MKRFESGQPIQSNSIGKLAVAFERAGIVLIEHGEVNSLAGPGVRPLRALS